MKARKQIKKQLENWMEEFYAYSSTVKEASRYPDFKKLKKIIKQL